MLPTSHHINSLGRKDDVITLSIGDATHIFLETVTDLVYFRREIRSRSAGEPYQIKPPSQRCSYVWEWQGYLGDSC